MIKDSISTNETFCIRFQIIITTLRKKIKFCRYIVMNFIKNKKTMHLQNKKIENVENILQLLF